MHSHGRTSAKQSKVGSSLGGKFLQPVLVEVQVEDTRISTAHLLYVHIDLCCRY